MSEESGIIALMGDSAWRDRLRDAIEASGKSYREISIAAGHSEGYVYGVIEEGKDATIGKIKPVIKALGVSESWILCGVRISRDAEEMIRLLDELPEEDRKSLRALAVSLHRRSP